MTEVVVRGESMTEVVVRGERGVRRICETGRGG